MNCAACQTENDAGRKFCLNCGARLTVGCDACGAPNTPGAKFCGECGASLITSDGATAAPVSSPATERRLVSVLFADLVGFTSISEARDAEDVRALLDRYFETCRDVITRYGGTVEKFIGDAVMAVWGTPLAREDDAERAVRAALDLVDAVRQLGHGAPGCRAVAARGGSHRRGRGHHRRCRHGDGRRGSREYGEPAPVRCASGHGAGRRGNAASGRQQRSHSRMPAIRR